MKSNRMLLPALMLPILMLGCHPAPDHINLAGTWSFRIDSLDQGIAQKWYGETFPPDTLHLPGSLTENGKGFPVTVNTKWTGQVVDQSWYSSDRYEKYRKPGNVKVPFWLQPDFYYAGPAWYQREIVIPNKWKDVRMVMVLERCHWESTVWVDGNPAGRQNSLAAPHRYDLTDLLTPGRHLLTIRMDNRMIVDVGENAHSVSDHTQSNWNGIVGRMVIETLPRVSLENIRLFPDVQNRLVKVDGEIANSGKEGRTARMELVARPYGRDGQPLNAIRMVKEVRSGKERFILNYPMGDSCGLWDEFSPAVWEMEIGLTPEGSGEPQVRKILFGMRDFRVMGSRMAINGRPLFLRGTLECAIFPKTGYPAMQTDEWRRIYRIIKAHGLNHMRFHSWCPPEAAFIAADLEGIYLYVETCAWTSVGTGNSFDSWVFEESGRIVEEYGNHPSFVMMSYGNEPGGSDQVAFLDRFDAYWKQRDDRRLYTSGAGWPKVPSADWYSTAAPRIQGWGEGFGSVINARPPQTAYDFREIIARDFADKPVVSHEIGQWCVYPDFKEMTQYTGVLKPRNFEIFQETLGESGLGHLADSFLLASGKLQAICYKADIEAALRTPNQAGFELLDLHDFPGQGTALVGVLNPFWEQKGYITPAEYSLFCNPVVPLARMKKLVLNNNEVFRADIEIANFGPAGLRETHGPVRILDAQAKVVRETEWSAASVPTGTSTPVGSIEWPLDRVTEASRFTLEVTAGNLMNHWDFWVYPTAVGRNDSPEVFTSVTPKLEKLLLAGGSAILSLGPDRVADDKGGRIALSFSSIFWNTAWTRGQPPHTLGILCNPKHPALAEFPTEYHSDFQWWDIVTQAKPIILNGMKPTPDPIVRVIDDWFANRSLALVFEVKVGKGKLIVTGTDLVHDLKNRPAARQLLASLQDYMRSPRFSPSTGMELETIRSLVRK